MKPEKPFEGLRGKEFWFKTLVFKPLLTEAIPNQCGNRKAVGPTKKLTSPLQSATEDTLYKS